MTEVVNQFDEKQIEDLASEYDRLMVWFYKSFPEGNIRLDVHSDQTVGTLTYTLNVLSGKEMTQKNQRQLQHKVILDYQKFTDISYMDTLKRGLFKHLSKQIQEEFNKEFQKEKIII